MKIGNLFKKIGRWMSGHRSKPVPTSETRSPAFEQAKLESETFGRHGGIG